MNSFNMLTAYPFYAVGIFALACVPPLGKAMLSELWRGQSRPHKRRRRNGGWRQRFLLEEDPDDSAAISDVVRGCLQEWSDGVQSSVQFARRMSEALSDGLRHPAILALSQLGGFRRVNSIATRS